MLNVFRRQRSRWRRSCERPRMNRTLRHGAVALLDVAFALPVLACSWLSLTRPALAYVDPSVMTYTIQALAGVAVALSAVLGVVWRRARRWLLRAMHVDENAGKAVEADAHALASDDAEAHESADAAARELVLPRKPFAPALSHRTRFVLALICALSLCYCVLFVAPLEVVIPGSSSLSFTIANVWLPLALLVVLCAVVIGLLASLPKGHAFDVVLAVLAAVCVCTLLQETLLNGSLPSADGSPVNWDNYDRARVVSAAVWVLVIGAFIALVRLKPLSARIVSVLACLLIVIAQSVGLGMLGFRYADALSRPTVTEEGLTTVSPKSNVIVFVLDMFDTEDMDDVMATYPEAADELGGFTWYHNSVGSIIPTRYGVPYIVTGHSFDPSSNDEFTTDQLESWFSDENLLDVANAQGYSVGVYSDSVTYGARALEGKTMNVHGVEPFFADFLSCAKALGGCGLYRDLPYLLKPIFWFTTDQLNDAVVPSDARTPENTPYVLDDADMHERLSQPVLTASDTSEGGAYRVIHCQGSHWPYIMDENGNRVTEAQDRSALVSQARGSLDIVEEYIRQLKDLGVYDNTTLIITADHGVFPWNNKYLPKTSSPILLVKPAGADASQPLQTSEVPTGHIDLPATLEWAVGAWSGDASDATGDTPQNAGSMPVFEVTDGDRPRYFYWNDHDGKHDLNLIEYEIDGEANDFDAWHLTGREWPVDVEGYN